LDKSEGIARDDQPGSKTGNRESNNSLKTAATFIWLFSRAAYDWGAAFLSGDPLEDVKFHWMRTFRVTVTA
jgi:hypothetical protein